MAASIVGRLFTRAAFGDPIYIYWRQNLGCELRESFGQNYCSLRDGFRRCIFVRAMAHSAATGNKQHCGGRNPRHEERIMIGAADHALEREAVRFASLDKG